MASAFAEIDLVAAEGATFEKQFVWKTGDPAEPVDLTGYSGLCHIRHRIVDEEPAFVLEDGVGVVIDDQTENPGGYKLFIDHSETEGVCETHRELRMTYDLRLTAPGGDVRLQQMGEFKILPARTRPWQT